MVIVALPRGALGLSAVCDCVISFTYSLTIFDEFALSNNDEKLYKCINELSNKKKTLVIMGDSNYPNIDWNNAIRNGSDFMNLIMGNFLCQCEFSN